MVELELEKGASAGYDNDDVDDNESNGVGLRLEGCVEGWWPAEEEKRLA